MVILVASCDNNEETFFPFHYCISKYWKEHPEIIYSTETIQNPYYKTINKNYPLEKWTRRIRETLEEINDDEILFMIDDIFIRSYVNTQRIEYARSHLKDNIACFNFEKAFNNENIDVGLEGFKLRKKGTEYELSLMCGLWNRKKLIDVLEKDNNPWNVEYEQDTKGYDYMINTGDYIINWGYKAFQNVGIKKGKWTKETKEFFDKEKIEVNYGKKGFID